MRPGHALDIHTALAVQLGNPGFRDYISGLGGGLGWVERGTGGDLIARRVLQSSTFHVHAEVTPKIWATAESYDANATAAELPPAPTSRGVMILDDPIVASNWDGLQGLIHMVSWATVGLRSQGGDTVPGYLVMLWNDGNRDMDELTQDLIERLRRKGGPADVRRVRRMVGDFYPIQLMTISSCGVVGPMWHELAGVGGSPGRLPETASGAVSITRLVLACWDLMSQTIARSPEDEAGPHVERSARRRAERAGLDGDVTVIALRREARPVINPGSGVKLDHQVPVREHYRHYWVKDPATGERVRVRRRIEAHMRGPEGTPVINKPKVYDLRR